jgi:hypothetical protein
VDRAAFGSLRGYPTGRSAASQPGIAASAGARGASRDRARACRVRTSRVPPHPSEARHKSRSRCFESSTALRSFLTTRSCGYHASGAVQDRPGRASPNLAPGATVAPPCNRLSLTASPQAEGGRGRRRRTGRRRRS